MTPYKRVEWHPDPNPHRPPPPSLFPPSHLPTGQLHIHSAPQLLPLFRLKETEKGDWELSHCFPLLPSLSVSLSLSFSHPSSSLSLPSLFSALGKRRSNPAFLSWQTDRPENKQKRYLENGGWGLSWLERQAAKLIFSLDPGLGGGIPPSLFFSFLLSSPVFSSPLLLCSPLLSTGIPLQGWESCPCPAPVPPAQPDPF